MKHQTNSNTRAPAPATYNALPLAPADPRLARPSLEARAFVAAFCAAPALPLLSWAAAAGQALRAIVEFRSACHRLAADGAVTEADRATAYDALEQAGLATWLDNLIGRGVTR